MSVSRWRHRTSPTTQPRRSGHEESLHALDVRARKAQPQGDVRGVGRRACGELSTWRHSARVSERWLRSAPLERSPSPSVRGGAKHRPTFDSATPVVILTQEEPARRRETLCEVYLVGLHRRLVLKRASRLRVSRAAYDEGARTRPDDADTLRSLNKQPCGWIHHAVVT